MPDIQLPATKPKRTPWDKGRLIGQKRPLLAKQVWPSEPGWNLREISGIWHCLIWRLTASCAVVTPSVESHRSCCW
ncbi:hypothetical protein SAMN05444000_14115 [Shimia gijangensis]|uniref:Uncharacterized protein n=1 Tax=Shimia gijangensis TaxID=1470563 RepID=A0A1M6TKU2_9RHOB|nr:hypothetical protein SAMN05444000_14115 [Shimia gijangensis]